VDHTIPEYLEHRPVYSGLVVPYVAVWSDEQLPGVARLHMWRGIEWVYTEKQSGVPDFGSTNSHRQRDCMKAMLCQICGKRGADIFVVPDDGEDGTHLNLWGQGFILNPPLHTHCYEFSQRVCPHLMKHEPLAVIGSTKPLQIVAYTTGLMALPIHVAIPGVFGREVICETLK
jgi:hypothetical protein